MKSGKIRESGMTKMFLKEFKDRLLTLYKQEWATSLRTNDRFSFYSTFKSNFSLSPYLKDLEHAKVRNVRIRLRLGVPPLKTHKLRFATNTTQADLTCPFCRNDTETEMHFILICPRYKEIRELYIKKQTITVHQASNWLFSWLQIINLFYFVWQHIYSKPFRLEISTSVNSSLYMCGYCM